MQTLVVGNTYVAMKGIYGEHTTIRHGWVHLRCQLDPEGGFGQGMGLILLHEDMTGLEHSSELKMITLDRKR
tara:strand:- start:5688 stop:5903 length:216 start_codon:yes stop_codon:yes gene_type:complete